MRRLVGLETEYGIAPAGKEATDLVAETVALLERLSPPYVEAWDYSAEEPQRDLRGFRAASLAREPEDEKLERASSRPAATVLDRCLPNGARLYNDHGHPEYSTPECRWLFELVAHDCAGERLLLECAARRASEGHPLALYKNNTDYHGFSYGCHENYLVSRELPAEDLISGLLPFLVTRQIFAGGGKVGIEGESAAAQVFQLSQRADFVTTIASVDTLSQRPILNTRDEPHADERRYRRFHNIVGDANMSRYATALKVGTTSLVLSCLEGGWRPALQLRDPVRAVKDISRDPSLEWHLPLGDGSRTTAVEIQRHYLRAAQQVLSELAADEQWALQEWEHVLDLLERDPLSLGDRLDWAIKRKMLEQFAEAAERPATHGWLQSLDLEYHNIDPARGLFFAASGAPEQELASEQAVDRAMSQPPQDTRAGLRGLLVGRHGRAVKMLSWGRVCLSVDGREQAVDLRALVDGPLTELNQRAEASGDLATMASLLGGGTVEGNR